MVLRLPRRQILGMPHGAISKYRRTSSLHQCLHPTPSKVSTPSDNYKRQSLRITSSHVHPRRTCPTEILLRRRRTFPRTNNPNRSHTSNGRNSTMAHRKLGTMGSVGHRPKQNHRHGRSTCPTACKERKS